MPGSCLTTGETFKGVLRVDDRREVTRQDQVAQSTVALGDTCLQDGRTSAHRLSHSMPMGKNQLLRGTGT